MAGDTEMDDLTVVAGDDSTAADDGTDAGEGGDGEGQNEDVDVAVVGEGSGSSGRGGGRVGRKYGDRVKGPWSPEEDAILSRLVSNFGARNWSLIARGIAGRSGKSCRLRWCNQLDPAVKRKPFTGKFIFLRSRLNLCFGSAHSALCTFIEIFMFLRLILLVMLCLN